MNTFIHCIFIHSDRLELKSIKTKHAMYKTHYLSNDPVKICEFKKYSNRLNHLKNINKKAYFCKKFDLCKNNLKATWKIIGNLIKRKTKGQTSPQRIVRNNKTFDSLVMKILLISLINILSMLAQAWPAELKIALKTLHNISCHLQLIVLSCPLLQKPRFQTCLRH